MVFDRVKDAGQGWTVHRELMWLPARPSRAAGCGGGLGPRHWGRMCAEQDLETDTEAELAPAPGIRRKLRTGGPGSGLHWGLRVVRLLEFTRCNDYRPDWSETTEEYKTARSRPLSDKMARVLPRDWSVEIVCLTMYLIHFFSRFATFFSIFYVRSLEYSYVFSDPKINFRTDVRSYPKNVPTVFFKVGVSEA
jgi:hypothetical protein